MKFLTRIFIIIGITFLSIGLYLVWERNDASRLAFHNYEYSASEAQLIEINNLPVKLTIPDLHLDLQVIPAKTEGKNWETTKEGVSYLTSSPVPGEEGNSVIYAHNWAGLFADLPKIKPGNVVEVEYADKSKKQFSIAYTLEVSPGDLSILQSLNDKRLTLYTCTGFLDSKRFVAVAFLQE
jgi:LPXTG-site transpeptidase (sortase) family protein